MARMVASIPAAKITQCKMLRLIFVSFHNITMWKIGGRMKARIVVARLPTNARHNSKRGIPIATAHDNNTRRVLMTQTIP